MQNNYAHNNTYSPGSNRRTLAIPLTLVVRAGEALQCFGDQRQAGNARRFRGAREECLESDADAHEGFARGDMCMNGGQVAGGGEGGEAVAEVTYAGEDEFLCNGRSAF